MIGGFKGFRSSRTLAAVTVVVAVFSDVFVYGVVILILPDILQDRVHVPIPEVQFWLSALLAVYNAAVGLCAPVLGYVADRFRHKKALMLAGLLALALSTAAFAAAPTVLWLVVARVLQGISAAVVWAVSLAVLVEAVGPRDMGVAMGWIALSISLGSTAGPFIGGIAYDRVGHYGTFAITGALVAVDMVLRILYVQPSSAAHAVDKRTTVSEDSEPRPSSSPDTHATDPRVNGVVDEETNLLSHQHNSKVTRSRMPVMFQLLAQPEILVGLWCIFLIQLVQLGLETVLPFHIQKAFAWSTQSVGFLYLMLVIPVLAGPLVGRMHSRVGHFPLATAGMLAIILGCAVLSSIQDSGTRDVVLFGAGLFAIGAGVTLTLTPEMTEVSVFAELKERESPGCFGPHGATAQSCALITVCVAISGVAGPSILGAVQTMSSWRVTCLSCCAMMASGLMALAAFKLYHVNRRRKVT